MNDPVLEQAFATLDDIVAPDLTSEILDRTLAPSAAPPDRRAERDAPLRRVVAAALALAIFAAAALLGTWLWERGQANHPVDEPERTGDPWRWAPEGWSELPPPPEIRDGAAIVWAGDRLIVWGGWPHGTDSSEVSPSSDGFAFDPWSQTWSMIPDAPARAGFGDDGEVVWTGSEALFFGVRREGDDVTLVFDPADSTWRELPGSPHQPGWGGVTLWTGSEVISWGGGDQGSREGREGATFDPRTGMWAPIADAPIGLNLADAAWDGHEMIVVGSDIDRGNHASSETALALSYDPTADVWRRLPDPPVSPQTSAVSVVRGRIIAWEAYSPAAAEYVRAADHWRQLDTGDLEGGECYAYGVVVEHDIFTWDCGEPAIFSAERSTWVRTGPPRPGLDAGFTYSVGHPYAADDAVVVEHIETVKGERGEPYIGSPDAPIHLWLWRPSTAGV